MVWVIKPTQASDILFRRVLLQAERVDDCASFGYYALYWERFVLAILPLWLFSATNEPTLSKVDAELVSLMLAGKVQRRITRQSAIAGSSPRFILGSSDSLDSQLVVLVWEVRLTIPTLMGWRSLDGLSFSFTSNSCLLPIHNLCVYTKGLRFGIDRDIGVSRITLNS